VENQCSCSAEHSHYNFHGREDDDYLLITLMYSTVLQVGFSAACFWEYILPNHPNIFQQISGALNLAGWDVSAAAGGTVLALIIFHDVITAAFPGSPTFSDENARVGGTQDVMI
jgi:hypothetical protein